MGFDSLTKRGNGLAWSLTLVPVLSLAAFYSFVLRARWAIGHWPTYNHPDPKLLGFQFHHVAVTLLMVVLPVAGLVALGYLGATLRQPSRQSKSMRWAMIALFGLAVVLWTADPGGFVNWFAD